MDLPDGMEMWDINEITGVCHTCNTPVEPTGTWEGCQAADDGTIYALRDFYCPRCKEYFTGIIGISDLEEGAYLQDVDEDTEEYWNFLNN